MEDNLDLGITFDLPKNQSNVIKAIGIGGGGSNAINYMFNQGIKGVDFVICNAAISIVDVIRGKFAKYYFYRAL